MDEKDRKASPDDVTLGGFSPTATASSGGLTAGPQNPPPPASGPASAVTNMNLNLMAILNPGTVLGGRYAILQMLGLGGMGAVYKAQDRELDRTIALKVIRPDLASNPEALARFKQELLTARQVTHRNVIRIFDIGEADGIKFITMEYLVGTDLRALLAERGKLPPNEAMGIIQQVCEGLEAAHREGIIHRDLKPGNIMLDNQGRVVVMDFGLARSLQSDGMTQTGAMLGTVEYMSPEQAKAEKLDGRSDIFTIGLILYELLTGKMPFKAESAIASLLKRTQERAAPVTELDPTIPHSLSDVVAKCLERQPNQRFQSAQEMFNRIDEIRGRRPASVYPPTPGVAKPPESRQFTFALPAMSRARWAGAIAAILVVAVGIGAVLMRGRKAAAPVAAKSVTVLVADFSNHTGDPVFDGTLEPMVNVALEGATFINAFSRGDARKVAAKLPTPSSKLDEQIARLVAVNQGLGVVVSGALERQGDRYLLLMKAVRAVTGDTIADTQVQAANKDQVLFAVTKAAAAIRKALGDTTSEADQLFALETLTATSLDAVHEYSLGLDALVSGKNADALKIFSRAADIDPNFGLTIAGKAIAARNLGEVEQATAFIKEAMRHIDHMTERERYRTRGLFYLITRNDQKCVEEYGALASRYPSDVGAHANLGICWGNLRNMSKAMEEMRRASEIVPKRVPYHFNLAFFQFLAGDFSGAEREVRATLELEPASAKGHLVLALTQSAQDKLQDAADSYHEVEKAGDVGASVAASGLADLAAYQGRFTEAANLLEQAAAIDLKAKRLDRAADKFAALANIELWRDHKGPAQVAAAQALANSFTVKNRFLAGVVYVQTGAVGKARELASGLGSELAAEAQAYAKIIEGEIALKDGRNQEAIKSFTDANTLLDTWLGHFDLGRAYLQAGAFTEADSEFERCVKRRGEAVLIFMDDVPTYAYFPAVYYYQGRVREGLKSSGFADSYRSYLSIREKAGEDPLIADIRRRIGQ